MRVDIKEVLIHDQSMSVQTKAAMLQRSVLDAWTDELCRMQVLPNEIQVHSCEYHILSLYG